MSKKSQTNTQRADAQNKSSNNKRKNYKRKQNFKKGFEREDRDLQESTNDPRWYSHSPELLRDAASIPFSWPTGTRIEYDNPKFIEEGVPGLLSLEVTSVVGTSLNAYSPINVASSAIYSYVRHANSGHANYDGPDLMMYLLGMSNIYSFVTWCQRLYGMTMMYDQRNRYMPYALITSQGVSFDDMKNHLADFRFWLNNFITKVASFAVPNVMPIFERLAFLYSNVYIEGDSVKSQMYIISPWANYFRKFVIANDHGRLTLAQPTKAGDLYTANEIMEFGESLFNAMWEQEDFGIMSGDILKAYGSNIVKLATIPVDYVISPVYDPVVLNQIKNAEINYGLVSTNIDADPNGYVAASVTINSTASPQLQANTYNRGLANKILVVDYPDPSPEVIIEATRFKVSYDAYSGTFNTGTELAKRMRLFYFDKNMQLVNEIFTGLFFGPSTTLDEAYTAFRNVARFANFKYHPAIFVYKWADDAIVDESLFNFIDIDNYGVLSNGDLDKMHQTAIMSLFAVPAIAKI